MSLHPEALVLNDVRDIPKKVYGYQSGLQAYRPPETVEIDTTEINSSIKLGSQAIKNFDTEDTSKKE